MKNIRSVLLSILLGLSLPVQANGLENYLNPLCHALASAGQYLKLDRLSHVLSTIRLPSAPQLGVPNRTHCLTAAAATVTAASAYWLHDAYKHHTPLKWDWDTIDTSEDAIQFPKDFLWGASTSSQQVEGGCTNNNWSVWEDYKSEQDPNFVKAGQACDFWERPQEFVQLIKGAGLNSFRMSIEWSRVQPHKPVIDHDGTVIDDGFDKESLERYAHICKLFKDNNIQLIVTLHHYTEPLWFSDTDYEYAEQKSIPKGLGGFTHIENSGYFATYAARMFETLHPYVKLWATFNNPTSCASKTYHACEFPPANKNMQLWQETLKNMLEAHVRAYKAVKDKANELGVESRVGILHNVFHLEPLQPWNPFDRLAVHMGNKLTRDPVYSFFRSGRFKTYIPKKVSVDHFNPDAPGSLDWIGVNNYSHGTMHNFKPGRYPGEEVVDKDLYTVYPEGLYRAIVEVSHNIAQPLRIPMYVTENGISTSDEEKRERFFERYTHAIAQACKDGHDVCGYLPWALTDNYEWGGYRCKYGLYAVDWTKPSGPKVLRPGTQPLFDLIKKSRQVDPRV